MALDKRYNPHQVEAGKYTTWKKQGYFKSGDKSKPPFSLVIPPPNVTGKLHLGHAWDNTIQDVITVIFTIFATLNNPSDKQNF